MPSKRLPLHDPPYGVDVERSSTGKNWNRISLDFEEEAPARSYAKRVARERLSRIVRLKTPGGSEIIKWDEKFIGEPKPGS